MTVSMLMHSILGEKYAVKSESTEAPEMNRNGPRGVLLSASSGRPPGVEADV